MGDEYREALIEIQVGVARNGELDAIGLPTSLGLDGCDCVNDVNNEEKSTNAPNQAKYASYRAKNICCHFVANVCGGSYR